MKKQYFYRLQKIVPEENQYRFYTLRVTPSLFNEWTLLREWGRIGSGGTLKTDVFITEEEARQKMDTLIKEKLKKGYVVI